MIILLEEIMQLIPHRKPFLFIDTCEIIKSGEEGVGKRINPHNYIFLNFLKFEFQ